MTFSISSGFCFGFEVVYVIDCVMKQALDLLLCSQGKGHWKMTFEEVNKDLFLRWADIHYEN